MEQNMTASILSGLHTEGGEGPRIFPPKENPSPTHRNLIFNYKW